MIKKLTAEDIDAIYPVETTCFHHPYTREQVQYELSQNAFSHVYGLFEEEICVGFIDYWITFEVCQLNQIAVLPAYRRKGYARDLMHVMIKQAEKALCESIMLEVRVSNTVAQAMYEQFGFLNLRIRKGYYADNGEDAMVMVKPLGGNY